MPDKAGDRFTDKTGKTYELRPDPQDGHLRPVTVKGANNKNPLVAILAPIIMMVFAAVGHLAYEGLRWTWVKITRWKQQKSRKKGDEK